MRKINFNKGWEFTLENNLDAFNEYGFLKYSDGSNAAARFYDNNNWDKIDLPHDWAVALPKERNGDNFYGSRPNTRFNRAMSELKSEIETVYNVGWYRKQFFLGEEYRNKRIFVEFEGVFRDSILWVNGVYIDRNASGYVGFHYDITDHLRIGEENSFALRVDSEQHEGWWYEGSGIYRNVFLMVGDSCYFKPYQTVIKADVSGLVSCSTVLVNETEEEKTERLTWTVTAPDGTAVATAETMLTLPPFSEASGTAELTVSDPLLWHVDTPNLYTLTVKASDEVSEVFGFRKIEFDPERGLLLNGSPIKANGACVHQDFGGVGVALPDNLQYYKIAKLKEMGVNAYRCSHHAPAPALLRACDELGMLVMDETRMFGTAPEALRQLQALIERDRNHPSVFIWCLGNEEFPTQNVEWSYEQMKKVVRLSKKWDDTRLVTYAGNNGPNFIGANRAAEVRGVNYIRNDKTGFWLDEYHKEHPEQPIIGTEETSNVLSRGSAVTDLGSGLLDCTGDVTMPWGSTPKGWVKYMEKRPYFAGSFMWTGFDYRGEPNPFICGNVSSSFGTIDLCGMPKPPFYYYRSWWTKEPVLKLAPHWCFKEGDTVRLKIYTNCEEVTLTLNGKTVGTYRVEPLDDITLELPFEAGVLRAEGTFHGQRVTDELRTAGKVDRVLCETVLRGEKEGDVSIVELKAVDKDGNFCPLASNKVSIALESGTVVGVGNGDPSDFDPEQFPDLEESRQISFFNVDDQLYTIPLKTPNKRFKRKDYMLYEETPDGFEDDFRNIAKYKNEFTPPETKILTTTVRDVEKFEYIEFERFYGTVTVYLNGEEIGNNIRFGGRSDAVRVTRPYRFYCSFKEGENEIRLETCAKNGNLEPISGYVKMGRKVKQTPTVHLHYGLARVFLKSEDPDSLTATLCK